MKNIKQDVQNKMLTLEQCDAIRSSMVNTLFKPYTEQGVMPSDGLRQTIMGIADEMIKDAQMSLIQNNVFAKVVMSKKTKKVTKRVIKKIKHVRK